MVLFQHRLTNVDHESMVGTCVLCGPVSLKRRSGKVCCVNSGKERGVSREQSRQWRNASNHLERLRRTKGKLDFNDYWETFRQYFPNQFADSPMLETDHDEATWQLKEALIARHGRGSREEGFTTAIASRRDREMA